MNLTRPCEGPNQPHVSHHDITGNQETCSPERTGSVYTVHVAIMKCWPFSSVRLA